jgi:transposase
MPSREAFTQRERQAIIRYFEQGWESPDIAPLFDASESGVRRVYQQYREEGRDKPAFENCGRKIACSDEQKQKIIAMVQSRPDIFLHELAEQVEAELKVVTSRHSLGRWLSQWGITRKKRPFTPRNSSVPM